MKSFIFLLIFCLFPLSANSLIIHQSSKDSLLLTTNMDVYFTQSFNKVSDTINIVRFAGNSKFTDEFRLNIISLLFDYRIDNVQAVFDLQFGDMPHLLARADQEFVKYIGRAYIGYTLPNKMKIQVGYLPDPIGIESTKPIDNMMTSISLIGYYEPDNFIGAKFITPITKNITSTLYFGNPFTLKDGKNKNLNYGIQLVYTPIDNFDIIYSLQYGNQAEITDTIDQNLMYNNFGIDFKITDKLEILAEADYGIQKGTFDDKERSEHFFGGFLAAQYELFKSFYAKGRFEFFQDKTGFMTGNLLEHKGFLGSQNWKGFGMDALGYAFVLEYRPMVNLYFKWEYRNLKAATGQHIFNNNTSEEVNYMIFNAGIRF